MHKVVLVYPVRAGKINF